MVTCRPQCHGLLWSLEALPCLACSHRYVVSFAPDLQPLITQPSCLQVQVGEKHLSNALFPSIYQEAGWKNCWGSTSQRMFGLLLHPVPLWSGPRAVHLGWPTAAGPREGYCYTSLPRNSDASPSDALNNPRNASPVFPINYYLGIETWLNIGFIFLKTQSHGRCCVLSLGGP